VTRLSGVIGRLRCVVTVRTHNALNSVTTEPRTSVADEQRIVVASICARQAIREALEAVFTDGRCASLRPLPMQRT